MMNNILLLLIFSAKEPRSKKDLDLDSDLNAEMAEPGNALDLSFLFEM